MSRRILLHACCAPCAGAVIERLQSDEADFAVFFSNSNISAHEEYTLRLNELRRYCESLKVALIEDKYDHSDWLEAIAGLENEPERGSRCSECFRYRLRRAAIYARQHGYELLTTTLASSRWKNLDQVNSAGIQVCEDLAEAESASPNAAESRQEDTPEVHELRTTQFWSVNWRKGGLQERRAAIIREQQFYNQNYCGCEFSKTNK